MTLLIQHLRTLRTLRTLRNVAAIAAMTLCTACAEQADTTTDGGSEQALAAVGVAVDDGRDGTGQPGDIALRSATAAATTRVAASTLDTEERNTAFLAGDQLWLYMAGALTRTGAAYKVAEGGTTATPAAPSAPLIVPHEGTEWPLTGYYPYREADGVTVTEQTRVFTVQQDQSDTDGYTLSDLMVADGTVTSSGTTEPNAQTGAGNQLRFHHRMAKLILRPYLATDATDGTDALRMTRLDIVGGSRGIVLDGPLLTATTTLSSPNTPQQPLAVYSGTAVTMPTGAASDDVKYVCLLPPQTLAQGALVRLSCQGGVTMTYRMNAATAAKAGSAYRMDLPVSTVTATVDIAPWQEVSWSYGEANDYYDRSNVKTFSVGGATFNMRYVEGGAYTMTTNLGFASGITNTSDVSSVSTCTLAGTVADYYLGETEVTEALWQAVMDGSVTTATPQLPKTNISMNEILGYGTIAQTSFITKLNTMTAGQRPRGYVFTLPTEVQWQYAAQGGRYSRGTQYPGSDTPGDVMWSTLNSGNTLHDVATKAPNELGLYDMAGSLWEPCLDGYELLTANTTYTDRFKACPEGDGTDDSYKHVARGGAYSTDYHQSWGLCRARHRTGVWANTYNRLGCRLALVHIPDYFSITCTGADGAMFTIPDKYEYSTDGASWTIGNDEEFVGGPAGMTYYLRSAAGTAATPDYPSPDGISFESGSVRLGGHLMSLAKKDSFEGIDNQFGSDDPESAFADIFSALDYDEYSVCYIDASTLQMPTNTAPSCYLGMFTNSGLTAPPALPATTLAEGCYMSMFAQCPDLTTAPALPATTLATECYADMFAHSTALTTAPVLPATVLATSCYENMFLGCTGLTTAPALPATTLATSCYNRMFQDCTALTAAPALPATTLAEGCYQEMFGGCSALTQIHIASPYQNSNNEYLKWTGMGAVVGELFNLFSPNGTIYYTHPTWTSAPTGSASGVPTGWTLVKE